MKFRYVAVVIFIFSSVLPLIGHCKRLDSIVTKVGVYNFLKANIPKVGVIFPAQHANISTVLKWEVDSLRQNLNSDSDITNCLAIFANSKSNQFDVDSINLKTEFPVSQPFNKLDSLLKSEAWNFYKFDIDGNGDVDLLIDGPFLMCVMDFSVGIEAHLFSLDHTYSFKDLFPMPDGRNMLILRHEHNTPRDAQVQRNDSIFSSKDISFDTVVYKCKAFTSYSSFHCPSKINKIRYYFRKLDGVGADEDYRAGLEVNGNGKCFLQYNNYNVTFYSMMDSLRLEKLWSFLSSIDFKSKCDNYRIEQDHGEGCTFAVYYDDGTNKIIDFWICSPQIELGYLSLLFSYFSNTFTWKPYEIRSYFERSLLPPRLNLKESKSLNWLNCNCY